MKIMKYRSIFFAISLLVLIPSLYFLIRHGLQPAIDFAGGSLLEVRVAEEVEFAHAKVAETVSTVYDVDMVQPISHDQYSIQGEIIANEQKEQVLSLLAERFGEVEELRFESVGATVSRELLTKTITAVVLVAGIITLYVWRQFHELRFGICAILAMFHDSLVLLGAFSILGYFYGVQVDILFVTALLTTLSFSIHDTIVVYDRIRELQTRNKGVRFETIVNTAVIETLGRSINNSVTIIVMLAALFMLGGETIRWFSLALLIGAVTGTYSSTFIAAPLLLLWDDLASKIKSRRK